MADTTEPVKRTSVSVYESDLAWLKRHQLTVSDQAGEWVTMADIVHGIITRNRKAEGEVV
jgi:hypothetical protein